ncbi:MAG: hypothetical protein K2X44_08495, partial [Magnetospirillum sp.]|nr:hypothetical protein [Magnetospirillum sp.]
MACMRGFGYSSAMSSDTISANKSAAAGIVGLGADCLSDTLDDILSKSKPSPARASTEQELLNCDYEPIRLEDLLCGLPPLPDDDFPGSTDLSLEPALLLAEIARPSPIGPGGWATVASPNRIVPSPEVPPLPPISVPEALRERDDGAMMDAILTVVETAEPAETAPAVPEDCEDEDEILLTDDFLVTEPPEPEWQPEPAADAEADLLLTQVKDFLAITTGEQETSAELPVSPEPPVLAEQTEDEDQLLVLTDDFLAEEIQASEAAPEPTEVDDADQVLVLTEEFLAVEAPPPEAIPEPAEDIPALETAATAPEPAPEQPTGAPAADDGIAAELTAIINALIAAYHPEGNDRDVGDATLPERLDSLAVLLSDPPPPKDFIALDALYNCWPKATVNSNSRALLAVAHNLSRNFGLPGKLPMASSKAWRM